VAEGPAARSGRLTTRAAVLGLVLCAVLVSAALPLREYLAQRREIATLEQQQAAQRARVTALEEQQRELGDPARIATLARDRLHYVMPGETSYIVLGSGAAPEQGDPLAASGVPAAGPDAPWYSQVWDSVRSADAVPPP